MDVKYLKKQFPNGLRTNDRVIFDYGGRLTVGYVDKVFSTIDDCAIRYNGNTLWRKGIEVVKVTPKLVDTYPEFFI